MRDVVIHYHLFKNAGSSIDKILETAFGTEWVSFDPKPDRLLSANDLTAVIDAHPAARAFSSHLIVPPAPGRATADNDVTAQTESDSENDDQETDTTTAEPKGEAFRAHPIVVLRDPILRVRSAYLFEWQKQQGTDEPIGSLAEYVREKLDRPRANAIEDFQTLRLAVTDPAGTRPPRVRSDVEMLADASAFIASLSAFGLVEQFDESLELFESAFRPFFPGLSFPATRANTTQSSDTPAHVRHARIKQELGDDLHAELIARNQMDIALYRYALGRFEALHAQLVSERRSGGDRREAA